MAGLGKPVEPDPLQAIEGQGEARGAAASVVGEPDAGPDPRDGVFALDRRLERGRLLEDGAGHDEHAVQDRHGPHGADLVAAIATRQRRELVAGSCGPSARETVELSRLEGAVATASGSTTAAVMRSRPTAPGVPTSLAD